ncbi:MAG: hypothetical protein ACW99R_14780 [Candidatus Hodarchaeales archaeon]
MIPSPDSLEEVGMHLLLLPIFLFKDFTIFKNRITFISKVNFHPELYRHLLTTLNLVTGHHFYLEYNESINQIDLFCSDKEDFFLVLSSTVERA